MAGPDQKGEKSARPGGSPCLPADPFQEVQYMRRQRRSFQLLALILGLSMIAAACGGDDDDDDASGDESSGDQEEVETQDGGDLVIGAEQQPDCMDWIHTCAGSS